MHVYVIAEIGINHNGSMEICKDLIDIATESGCDAVKFQKREIDQVYTQEFLDLPRESPWGSTQREQKMGLEFSAEQYKEIDKYCKEKDIDWFASAWDLKSQKFIQQFDCRHNKVASAMIVFPELLRMIAREGKHTFISTGMSTYNDIQKAVDIFREESCPFELMHTVSTYPMKVEDANLNVISTLRKKFNCDIGYSGHEVGLTVSYAAVAMGITSLERHITLSRAMYGSDQSASIEPHGIQTLVEKVREIEKAMGDGKKIILESEVPIANNLRQHINLS
jgi:N-acetylneuraminate synthase